MKKRWSILSIIVCMCLMFAFAGCGGNEPSQSGGDGNNTVISGEIITLNKYDLKLDVGETFELKATVKSGKSVTWETADDGIATVDADGKVTGVSDGKVKIYANVGDDRSECTVTVEEGLRGLPKLTLDISTTTLYKGYKKNVNAIFKVGAEQQQMNADNMQWSSSVPAVASVDEDGEITALSIGKTTVSLSYDYEGQTLTASAEINVTELAFLTLSLADGGTELASAKTYSGADNSAGSSKRIVANKVALFDADTLDSEVVENSNIQFTSSDENIATVDENGIVTSQGGAGSVTISAKYGDLDGDVTLNIVTSLNCKRDFDMLAFAKVLGKSNADWSDTARYVLTQDVDYNGALWIPIAAEGMFQANNGTCLGYQWNDILSAEDSQGNLIYGIDYDTFGKEGGLNKNATYFGATIEGNGYSVRNAKIMADAYLDYSTIGTFKWNVFGYFSGKLLDIGFDGFTVQTYAELAAACYSQARTVYRLTGEENLTINGLRNMCAVSSGFIARNTGLVQDVYVKITYNSEPTGYQSFMNDGHRDNTFIVRNEGTINRVVVDWQVLHNNSRWLIAANCGPVTGLIAVWNDTNNPTVIRGNAAYSSVMDTTNSKIFTTAAAYDTGKTALDFAEFTAWDTTGSGLPVLKKG